MLLFLPKRAVTLVCLLLAISVLSPSATNIFASSSIINSNISSINNSNNSNSDEDNGQCSKFTVFDKASDITLRYRSTPTTLTVRLETKLKGYIGFGLSPGGMMEGTEAVIGGILGPSDDGATYGTEVSSYSLTSYAVRRMLESDAGGGRLHNTTYVQGEEGSVLEFTMALRHDGVIELDADGNTTVAAHKHDIDGEGPNRFIWAVGYDNRPQYHQAYGAFTITLSPCTAEDPGEPQQVIIETSRTYELLFAMHGALATIAFGILLPIAVTASRARTLLDFKFRDKQAWFVIHSCLNTLAFGMTIVAVALAVTAYVKKGKGHLENNAHERVGAVTVVLMTVQVIAALFRPDAVGKVKEVKGEEPVGSADCGAPVGGKSYEGQQTSMDDTSEDAGAREVSSTDVVKVDDPPAPQKIRMVRTVWQRSHVVMGIATLGCGLYQMHSGLELYAKLFGSRNMTTMLWVVLGCMFLVSGGMIGYSKRKG